MNIALYSPIHIGIWIISGPKQPMGLTPASRYNAIVSCCIFCLFCEVLFLYLFWIACSCGCISCILFICLVCLIVKGININLIITVKEIIDRPKLSPKTSYKIDKLFIMGFIIKLFQKRLKIFILKN